MQNNPSIRQYGVIDLGDGLSGVRKSGWTGNGCTAYANHIVGANYTIQGNILLGPEILDSMEANFLNTNGTLACKLMAAMQGANVIGADTRCIADGTSSLSSFIKVARPSDTTGTFYLDIEIGSVPAGVEPIDTLQTRFDEWGGCANGVGLNEIEEGYLFSIYPNPADDQITISLKTDFETISIFDSYGKQIFKEQISGKKSVTINTTKFAKGIYLIQLNGKESMVLEIVVIE